jgi:hypothetical protein
MPLQKKILNLAGTTYQNLDYVMNWLVTNAGWTDAGTQTISFYHGDILNSNIQFKGIKNATGQIIYYNYPTRIIVYNSSSTSFETAILNLSLTNTNNNFISTPNEFFNASCVFPSNAGLNLPQITPAYLFYDNKNFILIIKNSNYSYTNNTPPTFLDYPNYYKVLGYLELGQYRVLFNDFVISDNTPPNYRNIVVWYNNQVLTNHTYTLNTLVSHDSIQAINNIISTTYSQKSVKLGYFDEVGMTQYTARVKLIVNDIPVANLPITVNKDLNIMERVATINTQEAHVIPVYNFQDALGNVKYIHLIIYPNAI